MFKYLCFALLALTVIRPVSSLNFKGNPEIEGNSTNRSERFLSLFSVVRFSNSLCYGNNGLNGTCFTSAECSTLGGTPSGTCAQGFGVCCTICLTTCGKTATVNNTYWANPGYPSTHAKSGQCSLTVKKCSPNICQIRLDFDKFDIADPDTSPTTSTTLSQCNTDSFSASGQSNNVPAICGKNTHQHMYLDMTPGSSQFTLTMLLSGTTKERTWKIRIAQIPCGTDYTAPDNCLQWFTESVGTFHSFNFQFSDTPTVQHLANQDYTICFRMNQGFCGICYSVCDLPTVTDKFSMSETAAGAKSELGCLTDWVQIPCATNHQSTSHLLADDKTACINKICGTIFTADTANDKAPAPVYSYRKPFEVRVFTTKKEETSEVGSKGFCLKYQQLSCTTG